MVLPRTGVSLIVSTNATLKIELEVRKWYYGFHNSDILVLVLHIKHIMPMMSMRQCGEDVE